MSPEKCSAEEFRAEETRINRGRVEGNGTDATRVDRIRAEDTREERPGAEAYRSETYRGEAALRPGRSGDGETGAGEIGAGAAGAGASGAGERVAGAAWRERAGWALRERMPVWLQARCGMERRGVAALAVLLLVAAAFAVQHYRAARPHSVAAPEVVRQAALDVRAPEAGPVPAEPAPTASAAPGIVVDVGGKVREPGVHRLPAGSRVADALRAAGGVRPGTSTDGLNRARFLVDGEQVIVGATQPPDPGPQGAGTVPGAPAPGAPVSLGTATVDQLDTLPGVGPVLAQHIVDYRTRHGGFRSVDELREVNGIGERRFADLRDLVRP
ncbi:ComEA family DNA-binding protein [Streptomyces sp. NPDC052077]|uniref:ComEA family DNA-binding protein n=1 Tax=Streptomyces sp. NPDC052077 TaxID=3154757 RepID=UPI0034357063